MLDRVLSFLVESCLAGDPATVAAARLAALAHLRIVEAVETAAPPRGEASS
jgi:hypothetical protein